MKLKAPPLELRSIDAIVPILQAALQKLLSTSVALPVSRVLVSEHEIPDDRPTQSSATKYVTEVRLGDSAIFSCIEEVGGFSQGTADWRADDFAGLGSLKLGFDSWGVTIEGEPAVVEVLATLLSRG